jgi:hypothetical protein
MIGHRERHDKDSRVRPQIDKPDPLPVVVEHIPGDLRHLKRWVCWRWTWNGKKWDKPPLQPCGRAASSTDPATWSPFDDVLAAHRAEKFDGIGITLGNVGDDRWLAGMDLDKVRDLQTGRLEPWAAWAVQRLDTYTEVSPSQRGVKSLVWGRLPPGRRDNERGVEMYDSGRYFTITGNLLDGAPTEVHERLDVLRQLHAELIGDGYRPAHDDRERALDALANLNGRRAENYRDWLAVGMALHAVDNSHSMCEEWDRWSQRCPDKYEEGKCAGKWATFGGKGLTLGSLVHWAKQDGWNTKPRTIRRLKQPANDSPSRWTTTGPDTAFHHTDCGNAQRLVQKHGRDLRHNHPWKKWLVWDGTRWRVDDSGAVTRLAKGVIAGLFTETTKQLQEIDLLTGGRR